MNNNTCYINRDSGEVVFNNQKISVRPKTFELLLLLASNPDRIFNKAELLTELWPDTVVEEQVVFQSINEIRKAFDNNDVIKTFPKRGYQWLLVTQFQPTVTATEAWVTPKPNKLTLKAWGSVSAVVILVMLLFVYVPRHEADLDSQNRVQLLNKEHQGLLFLPTDVSSLIQSQQWLRFGLLDSLINQFQPNPSLTVFKLEDTLEILNRVTSPNANTVPTLFEKSGASYIVETNISGVPGEYHLIYTFYTESKRYKQVLNLTNLDEVVITVSRLTRENLGQRQQIKTQSFDKTLQNDLLASGIELLEAGDPNSALSFFHSAVLKQPNNLLALYFLSRVQLETGKYGEALKTSDKALTLAEPEATSINRIRFVRSSALLASGKIEQGKTELELTESLSRQLSDWLYYAYSQSLLAKVAQFEEDFPQAESRLNQALKYQQLLNCPMGIAQSELDFAEFYLLQDDKTNARTHFEKANALFENKSLFKLEEQINHFKPLLEQG